MVEKSPAFQFYPKDWLSDQQVMLMCNEARGIYIQLLCFCWLDGDLPDDVIMLAQLAGTDEDSFNACWETVATCFERTRDGRLTNPRLAKEKAKQEARREDQSRAGKASAAARKANLIDEISGINTRSHSVATKSNSSSSTSSSSSKDKNTSVSKADLWKWQELVFNEIWGMYPRLLKRKVAFERFKKQIKTPADYQKIQTALINYKKDVEYQRNNGHPDLAWQHGATWFNNNWLDYVDYKQPKTEAPKPNTEWRKQLLPEKVANNEVYKPKEAKKLISDFNKSLKGISGEDDLPKLVEDDPPWVTDSPQKPSD